MISNNAIQHEELYEWIRTSFFHIPHDIHLKKIPGNGFLIQVKDSEGEVLFGRNCDLFRALTLLDASIREGKNELYLSESPRFDTLCAMIDVSRGSVPKPETIRDILVFLAKMGYNRLMLYTEDTFLVETYPYFGYMRGAYSESELNDIVTYAEKLGIECIPCIETLSHMENVLRWSYASEIKNSERTLLVGNERTYEFIEELIKVLRRCFRTEWIHIGMDEAEDIADAKYRLKNGDRSRFEVYSEHLERVTAICEKYTFKPMIWSDMLFRICSKKHIYCDPDTEFPQSVIDGIPDEITVVYWDYSNNDSKRVEKMIDAHRRLKRPLIFAGGIWTMNGFTPNYEMTFTAGMTAIRACISRNVRDVVVTLWMDNGGECSIYTGLLGLQMYAEGCWAQQFTEKIVVQRFRECTGFDATAFDAIAVDRYPTSLVHWHNASVSKQVLYSDILMGLFDVNFSHFDIRKHFESYYEKIESIPPPKGLEYLFEYYRKHHQVLMLKCDIGIRLSNAYQSDDRTALEGILLELRELSQKYCEFHKAFCEVWLKNNKPQGLECIDFRLGGMESRIQTAIRRVEAYLAGTIPEIPELAEKRLFFAYPGQTEEYPLFSMWIQRKIFSASQL